MAFSDSGPQYSVLEYLSCSNEVEFCSLSIVSAAIRTSKGELEYGLKVKLKKGAI